MYMKKKHVILVGGVSVGAMLGNAAVVAKDPSKAPPFEQGVIEFTASKPKPGSSTTVQESITGGSIVIPGPFRRTDSNY